jgi:hypothetical protein
VTPCGSCKNRRFGGTYRLHHQGEKISKLRTMLAVTSNRSTLQRNTSSLILTSLMTEAIRFPETSVLTRTIRPHIIEDSILRDFQDLQILLNEIKIEEYFIISFFIILNKTDEHSDYVCVKHKTDKIMADCAVDYVFNYCTWLRSNLTCAQCCT